MLVEALAPFAHTLNNSLTNFSLTCVYCVLRTCNNVHKCFQQNVDCQKPNMAGVLRHVNDYFSANNFKNKNRIIIWFRRFENIKRMNYLEIGFAERSFVLMQSETYFILRCWNWIFSKHLLCFIKTNDRYFKTFLHLSFTIYKWKLGICKTTIFKIGIILSCPWNN